MRGHDQQPRTVPVQHLVDLPVEPPGAVFRALGLYAPRPATARPVTVVVAGQAEGGGETRAGHGEGGGEGAGGEAREEVASLLLGAEGEQQGRGQDGGREQGRRGERPARLLAGEGELGLRAADTAVRLRKREPGQAELFGEGDPQRGVVPGRGVDGGPQFLRTAALVQQLAQGTADLVLFGGEAGVHGHLRDDGLQVM